VKWRGWVIKIPHGSTPFSIGAGRGLSHALAFASAYLVSGFAKLFDFPSATAELEHLGCIPAPSGPLRPLSYSSAAQASSYGDDLPGSAPAPRASLPLLRRMLPRAEKDHRLRAASSSERQIRDAYKRSAAGNSTGDNPRCFARAGTLFTWNVMLY
jgi:hypothetical protein